MTAHDHQAKARELHIEALIAEGASRRDAEIEAAVNCPSNRATERAIEAALRLEVPDGFVVVPREPTGDMLDAMIAPWMHAAGSERECLTAGWRDAIAAAPTLADEGES